MKDVFEILASHRSIRRYKSDPIPEDLLTRILDSARQAPTSSNLQTYSIIVVTDPSKKDKLAGYCGNQSYVAGCPVFLAMCPDLRRIERVCELRGYQFTDRYIEMMMVAVVDTALVAQNIVVAAEASGLGICMIGAIRNNPAQVSDLLKLPERVVPLMGICLGYPDHEPMIKPRLPRELAVHREEYRDDHLADLIADYDRIIKATGLYEGDKRKIAAPDGRTIPDDAYSWSEHSARRAATTNPASLRVHLREFLEAKKIGLG